jgi:hypothetical protein
MVAVPYDTAVKIPLAEPTDATPPLLLLQVPPPGPYNAVTDPVHIVPVPPAIAPGRGFTVTTAEEEHEPIT